VRVAERYGLPVVAHIYPIRNKTISHQPDDVYFAMRTGMELGVDLVKIPYTGDVASFRDIVVGCPVPAVAAGGPRCDTLDQAKAMLADVVRSGAAGATVGRNVWEQPDIVGAILTLKAVVHGR
jgi:fructose-bisphosphate aldolase/2-amino-3,7-dideoxy-D-threo-hept-6-ulosonate synthase